MGAHFVTNMDMGSMGFRKQKRVLEQLVGRTVYVFDEEKTIDSVHVNYFRIPPVVYAIVDKNIYCTYRFLKRFNEGTL